MNCLVAEEYYPNTPKPPSNLLLPQVVIKLLENGYVAVHPSVSEKLSVVNELETAY